MSSEVGNSVAVIDTVSRRVVRTVGVGARPRDIAISPDGKYIFVTGENDGSLAVLDGDSDTVLRTAHLPGTAPRPKGSATLSVTGTVHVGSRPWSTALSPDGRFLYSANGLSDDVSVVSTAPFRLEATIKVGRRPWGIAIIPSH